MRRAILGCLALGLTLFAVSATTGAGRRYWFPYYLAAAGSRDHDAVLRDLGPKRRATLQAAATAAGLSYPPPALTLVGLKQERRLEAWGSNGRTWKLLKSFPILAASGGPGPKLREGDGQVPEGVYRLAGFNPNSSYHLSLRVDYPNADDRAAARADGRTRLGGDIFIHGKAVSIGCIALGDTGIEELYLLVADVGQSKTRVLLAPSARPIPPADASERVFALYHTLESELRPFRTAKALTP